MYAKFYWILSNTFWDIRETVAQVAKNQVLRKLQANPKQTNQTKCYTLDLTDAQLFRGRNIIRIKLTDKHCSLSHSYPSPRSNTSLTPKSFGADMSTKSILNINCCICGLYLSCFHYKRVQILKTLSWVITKLNPWVILGKKKLLNLKGQ